MSQIGIQIGIGGGSGTKPLRIFAQFGQSNTVGKDEAKNNTNTPGIITPYTNVRQRQYIAGANTVPFPWVTFPAEPLRPRPFYLSGNTALGNMGPDLTFGRSMDAAGFNVALAKCAVNSSDLGSQWHPDSVGSSADYTYANLFTTAVQFIKDTERDLKGQLAGIVWNQGESDATNSGYATAYQTNLGYIISRFRDYWPNIPVVIVQLHTNNGGAFKATVRTAQSNYVAGGTNVALVNGDDLALQGDLLHYTADGYATLGTRIATAMRGLTMPSIITTTPAAWSTDATSGKATPNGPWEWGNFMLSAGITGSTTPNPIWHLDCQDRLVANGGDGNLHDRVSGLLLTAAGSPTLGNAVTGWAKTAAGFGGGTGVGVNYSAITGNAWNTNAQSVFALMRVRLPSVASEKVVFCLTNGVTGGVQVIAIEQLSTGTGTLKCWSNGVTTNSVNGHGTGNVMLIGLRYNRTATTTTLLTTLEKLTLPWHASADGTKGFFDWNGLGTNPGMQVLDLVVFTGANAELTDAQVKSLYQALGETIPWT